MQTVQFDDLERLFGTDLECTASESKICNGERLGWPAHSKIHLCPSQRTLRVGATRHSSLSPCRFRCRPLNSQHRSFPGESQPARKTMTHDWMMRCAGQVGGSRDAALVCPHRGPSCGSRVPRPNGRAVCRAARCCAALCGIAKPAPRRYCQASAQMLSRSQLDPSAEAGRKTSFYAIHNLWLEQKHGPETRQRLPARGFM